MTIASDIRWQQRFANFRKALDEIYFDLFRQLAVRLQDRINEN